VRVLLFVQLFSSHFSLYFGPVVIVIVISIIGNRTVTGTAAVKKSLLGLDSWIAAAEEVSLQTASEGGKRRCRRDGRQFQTRAAATGKARLPIVDSCLHTPNEQR